MVCKLQKNCGKLKTEIIDFMNIKKHIFIFCLCFFSQGAWSDNQYRPLSSVERHELSAGFSISLKNWEEKMSEALPVFSLKYSLYFPEVNFLLPEAYHNLLVPGLQLGWDFIQSQSAKRDYGLCTLEADTHSSALHFGLKGKNSYFEFVQAFVSGGWAQTFCYSKELSKKPVQKKLSHYFSYGLFLSLKILDRFAIYALDQDYGINDMGLKAECLHYYQKEEEEKPLHLCQLAFQLSF